MNSNLDSVKEVVTTDIFFPSYTHVNADISRPGIEKTGKLMAPSIALSHGIVPFSGEALGITYLFRAYHVSVSKYPPNRHSWQVYLPYGKAGWSPEESEAFVAELREIEKNIEEKPYGYLDFEHPHLRPQGLIEIREGIRLEETRQQKYAVLTLEEQKAIQNPKPDIYLFNDNLPIKWYTLLFQASRQNFSHPFVPAEINLGRYLLGMFTSQDVQETQDWIGRVVNRNVPVGSIDSLVAWEETMRKLNTYNDESEGRIGTFYWKIRENPEFKQRVIREVLSL